MTGRIGIVVAQLGGPRDGREVAPFIRSVFADPDTVALPGGRLVRRALAETVARVRAPAVRRAYDAIGGGSPILPVTLAQARALEDVLRRRGLDVRASVAMRHGRPDTEDAVRELLQLGAARLVLLPLYPQRCLATTGSAERELARVVERVAPGTPTTSVGSWHRHPSYVAAQAALARPVLRHLVDDGHRVALLCCAHGVPRRLAERGDPYVAEVTETVTLLAGALGLEVRTELAYQSRSGPVAWVGPDVRDVVRALGREGHTALCVVPVSFVSDHLETLHELDVLLPATAAAAGVRELRRVPTFNDLPVFGDVLADVIEEHLCTTS